MVCWFRRTAHNYFRDQSRLIAKWPLPFLIIPMTVSIGMGYGVYRDFDKMSTVTHDSVVLFLPDNINSVYHSRRIQDLFPAEDSMRDSYSLTQAMGHITLTDAREPRNALARSDLLQFATFIALKMKSLTVKAGPINISWEQLCYRIENRCAYQHPLFDPSIAPPNIRQLGYPYFNYADQLIDNTLFFGGVRVNSFGDLELARAIRIPFSLRIDQTPQRRYLNYQWQKLFAEFAQNISFKDVHLTYVTSITWPEEIERNGEMVKPYLPILVSALTIFAIGSCATTDWVSSKPWIGICGILNALCAIVSAVGTLFYCGYPFLQMVFIMPFLILSISVDNTFLLLNSWRMATPLRSVEDRITECVSSTAVSLTVTSLTDGLSFTVGSISQFGAVRIFCSYCALAVLYNYVYQMTFFLACLTLSGRRELANRHCLLFHKLEPASLSSSDGSLHRLCCTGGHPPETTRIIPTRVQGGYISEFFGTQYTDFIIQNHIRFLVLLLYCFYLAGSVWGCMHLQIGLDIQHLVPRDSVLTREMQLNDLYFSDYGGYAYAVVDATVPYHRSEMQTLLLNLYNDLCNTDYSQFGQFWLVDFLTYAGNGARFENEGAVIQELLKFLHEDEYQQFKADVHFNEDYTEIDATKMMIRLRHASSANFSDIANTLRSIFHVHGFPGFVFEPTFLLVDQRSKTFTNTLQNVAVAVVIVVILSTIFIRHFLGAFLTGISIISINLGVIGFLPFWSINLDIISMITIIMSIGFSADFVIHIVYHYVSKAQTDDGRTNLHRALEQVGLPIVQSAISTVLGVACLAFVAAYTVEAFVKTVVLVICFGLAHGIVFLPVILSFINPMTSADVLSQYHRIREYFITTIPRYFGQVKNMRMHAYFTRPDSPSSLKTSSSSDNDTESAYYEPEHARTASQNQSHPTSEGKTNIGPTEPKLIVTSTSCQQLAQITSNPHERRSEIATPGQLPKHLRQHAIPVRQKHPSHDLYGFLKQKAIELDGKPVNQRDENGTISRTKYTASSSNLVQPHPKTPGLRYRSEMILTRPSSPPPYNSRHLNRQGTVIENKFSRNHSLSRQKQSNGHSHGHPQTRHGSSRQLGADLSRKQICGPIQQRPIINQPSQFSANQNCTRNNQHNVVASISQQAPATRPNNMLLMKVENNAHISNSYSHQANAPINMNRASLHRCTQTREAHRNEPLAVGTPLNNPHHAIMNERGLHDNKSIRTGSVPRGSNKRNLENFYSSASLQRRIAITQEGAQLLAADHAQILSAVKCQKYLDEQLVLTNHHVRQQSQEIRLQRPRQTLPHQQIANSNRQGFCDASHQNLATNTMTTNGTATFRTLPTVNSQTTTSDSSDVSTGSLRKSRNNTSRKKPIVRPRGSVAIFNAHVKANSAFTSRDPSQSANKPSSTLHSGMPCQMQFMQASTSHLPSLTKTNAHRRQKKESTLRSKSSKHRSINAIGPIVQKHNVTSPDLPESNQGSEGELVQIVLNGKLGSRLDLARSMNTLDKSQESLADSDRFAIINTASKSIARPISGHHDSDNSNSNQSEANNNVNEKKFQTFKGSDPIVVIPEGFDQQLDVIC